MRLIVLATFTAACVLSSHARAEHKVEILRDAYGVPHIVGETDEAALFGLGYCVAEDRLAQMEQARLRTLGWTAAYLGGGQGRVEQDLTARRRFGGETVGREALARLDQRSQSLLAAFVAGINEYTGKNQAEVKKRLRHEPAPFEASHVVIFALARSAQPSFQYKLQRLALRTALKAKFGKDADAMTEDLLWSSTQDSVPTILRKEDIQRLSETSKAQSRLNFPASERFFDSLGERCAPPIMWEMALAGRRQAEEEWNAGLGAGSTAIALSGKRTASGRPMLISYPALGRGVPGPLYESHLISPSWNVIGAHFPLLPFISIGATPSLAFGQTNGNGDQTDVYVEELNPDNLREYRFNGEWKPVTVRKERIDVAGEKPVEQELLFTVHGPVERVDSNRHVAYALKDAVYADETTISGAFAMMGARSIPELGEVLKRYTRGQNILAVDRSGKIAFWHVGRQPIVAEKFDRRLPLPGTGEAEWQGFVPFDKRPQMVDPDWQFLETSNNKPAADWNYCGQQPSYYGPLLMRPWKLTEWLLGVRGMTFDQFEEINFREKYLNNLRVDPSAETVYADIILKALNDSKSTQDEQLIAGLKVMLKKWDGSSMVLKDPKDVNSTAIPVAEDFLTLWRKELFDATFRDEFGEKASLATAIDHYEPNASLDTLYLALTGRLSRDYFDDITTEQTETADEQIRRAAAKVLKQMAKLHSEGPDDPARWKDAPAAQESGPLKTPAIARGPDSYRLLAEIHEGGAQLRSALWAGQSEQKTSPHFSDQRENYIRNRHKPLSVDPAAIRAESKSSLTLQYSPGR